MIVSSFGFDAPIGGLFSESKCAAVFVLRSRYLKGECHSFQRRLTQNRLGLSECVNTYGDWYYMDLQSQTSLGCHRSNYFVWFALFNLIKAHNKQAE